MKSEIIKGFSRDTNGNRTIKLQGFSIQTNGNLPFCHRTHAASVDGFSIYQVKTMEKEILDYVSRFGTKRQKQILGVYSSNKSKNKNGMEVKV